MIYDVRDFQFSSGCSFNGIYQPAMIHLFEESFRTNKDSFINSKYNSKITSSEFHFLDFKNIHIFDIENLNKNSNDIFLYTLGIVGITEDSFGVNNYADNISIFDQISERAIYYSKKLKNFYITIYTALESRFDMYHFASVYKKMQDNNIPIDKLIIISNHYSNYFNNQLFLDKFKISNLKKINFLVYDEQLRNKGNEIKFLNDRFIDYKKIIKKKNKKCLILNRRLHWHRKIFLSLISYYDLFTNNNISFDLNYDLYKNNKYIFFDEIENLNYLSMDFLSNRKTIEEFDFTESEKYKIKLGYNKLQKIEKISLDVTNLKLIEGRPHEIDDKSLYENTYFSCVTETEFFNNYNDFITEKTLKPIQQLHPFIILGRPGILKYLKLYGFKTFSEFWDESYDNEKNNKKRLLKVFKLFKELQNKSDDEWIELLKKIKYILIHNRNLLETYSYENDNVVRKNLKKYFEKNEYNTKNPNLLQKT